MAVAANVYLMLYPKPPLAAMLQNEPELTRAIWEALSSITAEKLVGEGRVYGGGLYKLEPKELCNVRLGTALEALCRRMKTPRQFELFRTPNAGSMK
jgi:hypothetical protein